MPSICCATPAVLLRGLAKPSLAVVGPQALRIHKKSELAEAFGDILDGFACRA